MSAKDKPYIILPIIGIILAIVIGYYVGRSPIAGLRGEIDQISTDNLDLQSQIAQLADDNNYGEPESSAQGWSAAGTEETSQIGAPKLPLMLRGYRFLLFG